jgi:sugar phosphate isomerase/epimerase
MGGQAATPASTVVLFAGCLPATGFRDYVDAASTAGFDAISIWPLVYRRAQSREGLDPPTMRRLVEDAGLRVTDVDACGDWLPPATSSDDLPPMFRSIWSRFDFFDAAEAMGAGTVVAAALTPDVPTHDAAVAGFARLCDDAAERGLRVALEFMPFSGIPDLETAWSIVRDADRPNAGLVIDVGHFTRSGCGEESLRSVPPERVFSVQLSDGPAEPPDDLRAEAMFGRLLPGEGQFRIAAILDLLADMGVRADVGPELWQRGWSERPPAVVAADLLEACRRVLHGRHAGEV